MAQAYSDPKRESSPYALPDLEIWYDDVYEYTCNAPGCGGSVYEIPEPQDTDGAICPSCGKQGPGYGTLVRTGRREWFYWACFPGCMPDSDPMGPFATKAEALSDAREGTED